MAKKNVAVYDDSEGYIKRFLEYVTSRRIPWLEVTGFTKTKALKEYLEQNRVDLLLFSLEMAVEEEGDREDRPRADSHRDRHRGGHRPQRRGTNV